MDWKWGSSHRISALRMWNPWVQIPVSPHTQKENHQVAPVLPPSPGPHRWGTVTLSRGDWPKVHSSNQGRTQTPGPALKHLSYLWAALPCELDNKESKTQDLLFLSCYLSSLWFGLHVYEDFLKYQMWLNAVTHIYNPSYWGGEKSGGLWLEATPGKKLVRLHLNK
jgi:hypothetical protein